MALENAVIAYAAELGVAASGSREAPGVYVGGAKLASIGLRIRRGASYHGLALNVSLDLEPFERINVCGYPGLAVTRLADLVGGVDVGSAAAGLVPHLVRLGRPRRGAAAGSQRHQHRLAGGELAIDGVELLAALRAHDIRHRQKIAVACWCAPVRWRPAPDLRAAR